ncbi:helix-turn-helix domain-containing protein [Mycetocola sp. 2940]|uniref:TetR/AcrR family transcriptional regulator n=1 Tax=Mycetocola sp. 2940 TaxID=3156452 RepID=UPI003399FE9F
MSEKTSPRRRYDATLRRERAAQTRVAIVEAAAKEFLAHGYAGATIPAIAASAGVAVETVYRSAAGKAGLLEAAVQAALAGGVKRSAVPVEERPGIRRVIEENDPRRQIEAYVATQPGVWSRVGPLLRVLDEAAASDSMLQGLREQHAAQRRRGLQGFADLLLERGALREDVSAGRAADILWALCAQANYEGLVSYLGWSDTEYTSWLSAQLTHALLHDGGAAERE